MADIGQRQGGGGPWGDIYSFNPSHINHFVDQMYAEERQRQQLRQQQAQLLDNEFAKNVANIRDADVPDVTKKYGDWKLASQQAMRQKGGVPPEQQLDLLRKKAEIFKTINASKQGLQDEDELRKEVLKNPDQYDDNASTYLAVRRKTPIGGLSQYKDPNGNPIDLGNLDTYRYKGTQTDFSKIEKEAAGTPKQVFQEEKPLDGGLQMQITPYMYGNTPAQFYESYLGSLSQRKAGRDAAAMISATPPEVIGKVQEQYQSIPAERWKKMGVEKPQELVITPDDSQAQTFAKHKAQLYALNSEPKQGMPVYRENKAAVMAAQEAKERRMEGLKQANAKALIGMRHELKVGDEEEKDLWVDRYVDTATQEARQSGKKIQTTISDGTKVTGNPINVDPLLAKAVGIDAKNPGTVIVTEDGKYVPIFYETNGDGRAKVGGTGNYEVKRERSAPLTEMQVKVALGKTSGVKQMNKEAISAVRKTTGKNPLPAGKPRTVKQGGYTYQWNEASGKYE